MSFLAVVLQSWLIRQAVTSFLLLCFHFSWKHVAFTWLTRVKKCSTAKSNNNITTEGERIIKAAGKDPSTTVVTYVWLVCNCMRQHKRNWILATVNTDCLFFYYCSVSKWILQFHWSGYLLFALAAKWFVKLTTFVTVTFVLPSQCAVFHLYNLEQNWCCSLAVLMIKTKLVKEAE